ncbi:MAG TPA: HD domain-containing phosphohydrolase [Solirubrobacteraceae bacterium]|nr:HD domain-containing phosphohydrolase [Solirubrobacteraceae bacterium]
MDRSRRPAVMVSFAVLGVWVACLELQVIAIPGLQLGPIFGDYAHNVIEVLAGVLCLGGAWQARREQSAWMLVGIGVLAWALGNVYYTVVLYDLESPPIPSPADAGFLLFPVLTMVGVLALLRARTKDVPKTLWTDGSIAALAVTAVSAAVIFETAFDNVSGKTMVVATSLAYPLTDLLLIGVVIGALASTGWRLDRTWVTLAAGIAVFWLADSFYLVESVLGTLQSPAWYDIGWSLGLLLVAYASWQPAVVRRPTPPEGMRFISVPLGFGAVGLAMLIYGCLADMNPVAVALAALSLVAVMARLVLTFRENVAMLRTSRDEALTDALTGLGNRRALSRELATMLPEADDARPVVLVLFDLDGFKHYNDTFGHPAGDALLVRLGGNLATYLSGRGRAFRMGGDEFCALFEPGDEVADPIIAGAASALTEHGEGFNVTSSYGAIVLPREAQDATEALRIADQRMYEQKNAGRTSATRQSKDVLVRALAERAPELFTHLEGVAELAEATAHRLGLTDEEAEQVRHAAELHDVGKVAIPDAILTKPGPLDPHEWEFIRRHTLIGERIIAAAPALGAVASLVRSSHERWDGTGYPDRLGGQAVAVGARIVGVADAFSAMTADRPYSPVVSPASALAELRRCAGSQFDPVVVEAFCASWSERGALAAGPLSA